MAQGNQVALSVDAFLRGKTAPLARHAVPIRTTDLTYNLDDYAEASRAEMPTASRRNGRAPTIELGFDEATA